MARGGARPDLIRDATMRLFSQHGVAGTSLQMVADELGVTKAAIYHHHRTKQSLIDFVLAPTLADLQALVDAAEASPETDRPTASLIAALADFVVSHRSIYRVMIGDITVSQMIVGDLEGENTFGRLHHLVAGPDPDPQRTVLASIFLSGLIAPSLDPNVTDLDDQVLRRAIIEAGDRLLA